MHVNSPSPILRPPPFLPSIHSRWRLATSHDRLFPPAAFFKPNSELNRDAAISVRNLHLSFGGGGSRKQVYIAHVFLPFNAPSLHTLSDE